MKNEEPDFVKVWTDCVEFDLRQIEWLKEQFRFTKKQLELNKKRLAEAIKYKELHG